MSELGLKQRWISYVTLGATVTPGELTEDVADNGERRLGGTHHRC